MKTHHKHLHLARRKMGHIMDEIYTALLHYGSKEVDLRILREEGGLRLYVKADYDEAYRDEMERMGKLLQPEVRNLAMVEMYWELAGEDQYTSESEMALVGQMADSACLKLDAQRVEIELYVEF